MGNGCHGAVLLMTTKYATEIAETYADLLADGGPVVFTAVGAGQAVDPDTGLITGGADISAAGVALQIEDDPEQFRALGLTLRSPITLMVAASGLAFAPAPTYATGSSTVPVTVTWAGNVYAVKSAEPFAPDAYPIYYTVIGDR